MPDLRDALFEHEMFDPKNIGTSYPSDHFRNVEASWEFTREETLRELDVMKAAGLLTESHKCWQATIAGKIEREKLWQALHRRHPALNTQDGALCDLVLALVISNGAMSMNDQPSHHPFPLEAIFIHLWSKTTAEIETAIADLELGGRIKLPSDREPDPRGYVATTEGRIHYFRNVLPRLGLLKDYSILAPLAPDVAPPMFADLGLSDVVADNLKFRWQEAERCRSAGAWLALTVLHGSILEALLLAALENNLSAAMTSPKAPRDKTGAAPLKAWKLEALLNVAGDIGLVEPTLALYGHALRDARNLIHPAKQVRERSQPDENVTEISGRVIRGVINSLRAHRSI